MLVITEDTILGQIKDTINSATSAIKYIQLTEAEMAEFIKSPEFKIHPTADKHYAENTVPVPTQMTGVKQYGDTPRSCIYMGIRLIVKL
jgi:hypothetical protein